MRWPLCRSLEPSKLTQQVQPARDNGGNQNVNPKRHENESLPRATCAQQFILPRLNRRGGVEFNSIEQAILPMKDIAQT